MKLIDLVKNIQSIDQESVIFQEHLENVNADIIISHAEEGDEGVKEYAGKKYYYLIEVFLAKDFIEDWLTNLDYIPSQEAIAQRLHEYAVKDA